MNRFETARWITRAADRLDEGGLLGDPELIAHALRNLARDVGGPIR